MADVSNLEAEERALVALARQTMLVYALTHSERSFKLAHDALQRADLLRREAFAQKSDMRREIAVGCNGINLSAITVLMVGLICR